MTDTTNTPTNTPIQPNLNTLKPKPKKLWKMFLTNYLAEKDDKSVIIQKKKPRKMSNCYVVPSKSIYIAQKL